MAFRTLSRFTPEAVSWLSPGRLALGKLAILDGNPDMGKSFLTLDLCARGLATREPVSDDVYRLGVTDPGVALLREQGYRPAAAPRRGWRALWPFS